MCMASLIYLTILESAPLVLRIPVQWYVTFLEICDQIWTETFADVPLILTPYPKLFSPNSEVGRQ